MQPYITVSPITGRLVQVHAIVEKIAGVTCIHIVQCHPLLNE